MAAWTAGRIARPYCRPVNTGPTRMDTLKTEYGHMYDLGEDDGWYIAVPLKHPGGVLSAFTPRLLAERIAADITAVR
jgi:hypothetical protein